MCVCVLRPHPSYKQLKSYCWGDDGDVELVPLVLFFIFFLWLVVKTSFVFCSGSSSLPFFFLLISASITQFSLMTHIHQPPVCFIRHIVILLFFFIIFSPSPSLLSLNVSQKKKSIHIYTRDCFVLLDVLKEYFLHFFCLVCECVCV